MALGPIFRRELMTSARRGRTIWDRTAMAGMVGTLILICLLTWDWKGWDRESTQGAADFVLSTFGIVAVMLSILAIVAVPGEVAPGVAMERDRKTLDALLATELSSAEIVLGSLAAGLTKYVAGLLAALPLIVMLVVADGVDIRLVLLSFVGLGSTAFLLGALSVAVSIHARTPKQSVSGAVSLASTWLILPFVLTLVLPRAWPSLARWVSPVAVWLLASSPMAAVANICGVIRQGTPVDAMLRMITLQVPMGLALLCWAIWKLRPASRAVYDFEGRSSILRALRTRNGERRPCGDDPVFWNERYSMRGMSDFDRISTQAIFWAGMSLLAYLDSWFAVPAFWELIERGYGSSGEMINLGEPHPFARMLSGKFAGFAVGPSTGQARLEFNLVLRQLTSVFTFFLLIAVAGSAAESIASEKERDTWLALLATPLSGAEILRAKILGSFWRMQVMPGIVILWTLGLILGAVHPLGYLASMVSLGISCWFFAAFGVRVSLWAADRKRAGEKVLLPSLLVPLVVVSLLFFPGGTGSVLIGGSSPPFVVGASLLSYEDVATAKRTGGFPSLKSMGVHTGEGAAMVLAAVAISLTAQALAAYYLSRAAVREFDAAVGRPIRPQTPEPHMERVAVSSLAG